MSQAGLTLQRTHTYGQPTVQAIRNNSVVAAISARSYSDSPHGAIQFVYHHPLEGGLVCKALNDQNCDADFFGRTSLPLNTSREKVYRKMEQALRNWMGDN